MRLRYSYRLYPAPGQRQALARAFGCARVVFNDSLRARRDAYGAGLPYITDAELSTRLTEAKAAPERAWLGEVSAVVLQQALADLNTAYRNFFASLTGQRTGPKIGPPRFRSRKDRRQAIRFTATPGSPSPQPGSCDSRRSATCRSAGPATCPQSRHRSP
jgi:transposase